MSGFSGPGSGIGSIADMIARLRAVLPTGWFPQSPPAPLASATPVLDGVLSGIGTAWSLNYGLLFDTAQQTRIATASLGFLDLIAADFFAGALVRNVGETDAPFRSRILANLLVRRGTRQSVSDGVRSLTGQAPTIIELQRGADCGGYGHGNDPGTGRGGYGTPALIYGSAMMNFQYLVIAAPSPAFAPGLATTRRSMATYVDASGLIVQAPPMTIRPLYQLGVLQGPLIERGSFNLVVDSRNWTPLARTATTTAGWSLSTLQDAPIPGDRVLNLSIPAGGEASGPGVSVAAGGRPACGSAWILIGQQSGLSSASLILTDLTDGTTVASSADMSSIGVWQRLSATLTPRQAGGPTLQMAIAGTASSGQPGVLLTQCWQIEPGSMATSYIPTSGCLGLRDADVVSVVPPKPVVFTPTVAQVMATIAATEPIATIGWTAIVPPVIAI